MGSTFDKLSTFSKIHLPTCIFHQFLKNVRKPLSDLRGIREVAGREADMLFFMYKIIAQPLFLPYETGRTSSHTLPKPDKPTTKKSLLPS